jgi:hypothetical protein
MRLQLEKQSESTEKELLDLETQLGDRLSAMPTQAQQEYFDLQNEVRCFCSLMRGEQLSGNYLPAIISAFSWTTSQVCLDQVRLYPCL